MNPGSNASGFAPPDGSGGIFIVDQIGRIRIVDAGGTLIAEPFLDLGNRMVTLDRRYDERGLLSMVFHPDFQVNGRFFVFYNVPRPDSDPPGSDCRARISEFLVSPADADKADPQSERILLEVPKPQANHNGGQLAFGPEGYLYISLGDGGNANDRGDGHTPATGNGQDPSRQLGKILRYNASEPGVLTIPPGNPFVDVPEILPEVYAYGLRNRRLISPRIRFVQRVWLRMRSFSSGSNCPCFVRTRSHPDLADVVEQPCVLDDLQLGSGEPKLPAEERPDELHLRPEVEPRLVLEDGVG